MAPREQLLARYEALKPALASVNELASPRITGTFSAPRAAMNAAFEAVGAEIYSGTDESLAAAVNGLLGATQSLYQIASGWQAVELLAALDTFKAGAEKLKPANNMMLILGLAAVVGVAYFVAKR